MYNVENPDIELVWNSECCLGEMAERSGSLSNDTRTGYRFGFNGKESDSEGEWGDLTHYDYGFRIYNPGIARFLSVDPLTNSYPELTPYQFASDSPMANIDLDGLESAPAQKSIAPSTKPAITPKDAPPTDGNPAIHIPDPKSFIYDFRPQNLKTFDGVLEYPLSIAERIEVIKSAFRDYDKLQKVIDNWANRTAEDQNYYNRYLAAGQIPDESMGEVIEDVLGEDGFDEFVKECDPGYDKRNRNYVGDHVIYGIEANGELIKIGLTSNMAQVKTGVYNGHYLRPVSQVNILLAEDEKME